MKNPLLKFLNDNHIVIIGLLIAVLSAYIIFGCQPTVQSLIHPDQEVTRAELQAEWEYYSALMKARVADLDDRDALRQQIIDQANLFATTGTINPVGVLGLLVSIGAIGFGLDSRRKLKNATQKTT